MSAVVALVGRPNVGKSTLFNALTRSRDAIVADLEGLTRDRKYGRCTISEQPFIVVDTGGLIEGADGLDALTSEQALLAIEEADLVLFVVDARAGVLPEDEHIAQLLRNRGKQTLVVANKTDGLDEQVAIGEFFSLGFEQVLPTAAAHRRNINGLVSTVEELLPAETALEFSLPAEADGLRLAILGRPNVGKSTLVNRLVGEERVLAYDMPGTTRDTVYVPWERDGRKYVLIDTAGVRRRSKVDDAVEKFSVIKALQAVDAADVTVLLIDAREGIVDQDTTILSYILKAGRAVVIAINKWDGLDPDDREQVLSNLSRKLSFISYAERVTISALHGSGLRELLKAVNNAALSAAVDVSSSRLTRILEDAYTGHQPPMVQGKTARLRFAHLGGHNPLRIVIHGSRTSTLPESYKRYLANEFRTALNLVGIPVFLRFKDGENPFSGRKNKLTDRQVAKRKRLKKFVKKKYKK